MLEPLDRDKSHKRKPQFSLPVDCAYCGKTYGTGDHKLMAHTVPPERPICMDCLHRRNMDLLS